MLLIAKIGNSSRKPQNPLKKLQQRNKVAPADCQCHQSIHLAVYSLDNKNDCLKKSLLVIAKQERLNRASGRIAMMTFETVFQKGYRP